MKIFIYKTIIAMIAFFILFEITINSTIKQINKKIDTYTSPAGRHKAKETIISEMKSAIKKENYFTEEEREVISKFIKKITSEIKISEK